MLRSLLDRRIGIRQLGQSAQAAILAARPPRSSARRARAMRPSAAAVLVAVLLTLPGCEDSKSAASWSSAADWYRGATEAWEAGDLHRAAELLDRAIESGALGADAFAEALVLRALVRGCAGEFSAAHKDLDWAAQGAGDMASIHAARAFLLRRQGKRREAAEAGEAARQIDPTVPAIKAPCQRTP